MVSAIRSSSSGMIKHRTQVEKVIDKIKTRQFTFSDIQDTRIATVLRDAYLKQKAYIHPKMRVKDVEEIKQLATTYAAKKHEQEISQKKDIILASEEQEIETNFIDDNFEQYESDNDDVFANGEANFSDENCEEHESNDDCLFANEEENFSDQNCEEHDSYDDYLFANKEDNFSDENCEEYDDYLFAN